MVLVSVSGIKECFQTNDMFKKDVFVMTLERPGLEREVSLFDFSNLYINKILTEKGEPHGNF